MKHVFIPGNPHRPVIVTLHGTGGDEHDLTPLARAYDPSAPILGVRGSVTQNGMGRFFLRNADGSFDEDDYAARTFELASFLKEAGEKYGFVTEDIILLGYSNGANMALSLILRAGLPVAGALLHHATQALRTGNVEHISTKVKVFMGSADNDPWSPADEQEAIRSQLTENGCEVTIHWDTQGHAVTQKEIQAGREWYAMVTEAFAYPGTPG